MLTAERGETLREQIGWAEDVCFECGGELEADVPRGTDSHPPLCRKCGNLWYPPSSEDTSE